MIYSNKKNEKDKRVREYIIPQKIIKTFGNVENADILLEKNSNQTLFDNSNVVSLETVKDNNAAILIDFGFEFCGGVSVTVYSAPSDNDAKMRLCFGESVNEALSHVGEKNSCNDHNPRDFEVSLSFFSTNQWGNTGYRFLYIELLTECKITLTSVQGVCVYKPYKFIGSFKSSDKLLNEIYKTAAHTCHMCMQDEIWDGIKRDRLVWIGDLYPELMTIKYLFGNVPDVESALKFSASILPENAWINSIPTYSLWWIINADSWCCYSGDERFLANNKTTINRIIKQILDNVNDSGVFTADDFIDWPTKDLPAAKEGVKALTMMFYNASINIKKYVDADLVEKCIINREKLKHILCSSLGFKQIASLLILNDMAQKECVELLKDGNVNGYSTFMSYFIFSALSKVADEKTTLNALKEYYGAMLELGATTFWEDFDISWKENSCRIDEICPENKRDIHGDNGKYCYQGFRHSLCHGWSSGPLPFLTEYVLGINIIDRSCKKIRISPHVDTLKYVSGSIATPYGKLSVEHKKDKNGKIITKYKAPKEIEVICEDKNV